MEYQKGIGALLQKRRVLNFQRQKARRDEFVKASRMAFSKIQEEMEETPQIIEGESLELTGEVQPNSLNAIKRQRIKGRGRKPDYSYAKLAKKLQVSNYLISLPEDFGKFMMYSRPAGKKVIIVFKGKKVVVINKLGQILLVFTSNYLISQEKTILEGIIDEDHPTRIFITDMIQWKGDLKVGQGAMFRHFWLNSNLPKTFLSNSNNDFQFLLIELFEASKQNFERLYKEPAPYKKDGIMFVHQESLYESINPGSLFWKDRNTSPYFDVTSPMTGIANINDGCCWSLDNNLLLKFSPELAEEFKGFKQIKFSYTQIGICENSMEVESENSEMSVSISGFQCLELLPRPRASCDILSKLIFQSQTRVSPITAEDIYSQLN